MSLTQLNKSLLQEMIDQLDLPRSIEKKARARYLAISEWLKRPNSSLHETDIEVFSQGSFALGTTIKPIDASGEYDLDMGIKIKIADFKTKFSQEDLKKSIGDELTLYRKAKGIENPLDEKRRCWCLKYKDEVHFHLDIVPCIPIEDEQKESIEKTLNKSFGYDNVFSRDVSRLAINITDNERKDFKQISSDWNISNPQGYLKWFQDQMVNEQYLFKAEASVEPIPSYTQKTILQRCIQLLKRHRDEMYPKNNKSKPISVIITTLAARAYQGETNLEVALINILNKMPQYIYRTSPRVPNPVKPEEDFTDRWDNPDFSDLMLEQNFYMWLNKATLDFKKLVNTKDFDEVNTILKKSFSIKIDEVKLENELGYTRAPKKVQIINTPQSKPWCH